MKCIYRFPVSADIRLTDSKPIPVRNFVYYFETNEEQVLTNIRVTATVNDREQWPQICPSSEPGVKATLRLHDRTLPFIQVELRAIAGLLYLYGLKSVDIDNPAMEWVPENDLETNLLRITGFRVRYQQERPLFPLSFDTLAKAVIAAVDYQHLELPLSFLRNGRIAVEERRYIEAIWQFYFIIETLFGNGKFKRTAIKRELKRSVHLRTAIKQFLDLPEERYPSRELREVAFKKFHSYDVDSLINYLVDLRGSLHHHTFKRKGVWHPAYQGEYNADSFMFEQIALNLALALTFVYLKDTAVNASYLELYGAADQTG